MHTLVAKTVRQKVGTGDFEVSSLNAAFQIPYTVHGLKYLCKISAKITYLALLILPVDSAKTRKLEMAKNFTLLPILFLSSMQTYPCMIHMIYSLCHKNIP